MPVRIPNKQAKGWLKRGKLPPPHIPQLDGVEPVPVIELRCSRCGGIYGAIEFTPDCETLTHISEAQCERWGKKASLDPKSPTPETSPQEPPAPSRP